MNVDMVKVVEVLIFEDDILMDKFPIEGVIFDKNTGILTVRKRSMQYPTNKEEEIKDENI